MDYALELNSADIPATTLELLISTVALQKATLSFLCGRLSRTDEEANEMYDMILKASEGIATEIMQDLYERRGKVNLSGILPKGEG